MRGSEVLKLWGKSVEISHLYAPTSPHMYEKITGNCGVFGSVLHISPKNQLTSKKGHQNTAAGPRIYMYLCIWEENSKKCEICGENRKSADKIATYSICAETTMQKTGKKVAQLKIC